MRRLHAFSAAEDAPIYRYGEGRDRPDIAGTSVLSPYLRWGMISHAPGGRRRRRRRSAARRIRQAARGPRPG